MVPYSCSNRKFLPCWCLGNQTQFSASFQSLFIPSLPILKVYLERAMEKGGWEGLQRLGHLAPLFISVHSLQARSQQLFWVEDGYLPDSRWNRFLSPVRYGLRYDLIVRSLGAVFRSRPSLPGLASTSEGLFSHLLHALGLPWTDFAWFWDESPNIPPVSQPLIYT